MLRAVQVFIMTADPSPSAQGVHTASWTQALAQTVQTPRHRHLLHHRLCGQAAAVTAGHKVQILRKRMQPNAPFVIVLLNCYEHLSDLSGLTAPLTCWPLVNLSALSVWSNYLSFIHYFFCLSWTQSQTHSYALIHANVTIYSISFHFLHMHGFVCMIISCSSPWYSNKPWVIFCYLLLILY